MRLHQRTIRAIFAGALLALPLMGQTSGDRSQGRVPTDVMLGRSLARTFEQRKPLSTDPALLALVDRVGRSLAPNSDSVNPIVLRVIDSNESNVFSFVGGYVYVTSGLVRTAGTEAELAWAIAQGFTKFSALDLGISSRSLLPSNEQTSPIIFTGGIVGYAVATSGYQAHVNALRRDVEEADVKGLQLIVKSGYDPNAAVTFLERAEALSPARVRPDYSPDGFLVPARHPAIGKRIKNVQESAKKLPQKEKRLLTTQEFDQVQSRLSN